MKCATGILVICAHLVTPSVHCAKNHVQTASFCLSKEKLCFILGNVYFSSCKNLGNV